MKLQVDDKFFHSLVSDNSERAGAFCEAVILAGGKSSRMGKDKCSINLGGGTLLSHVDKALMSVGFDPHVLVDDLQPGLGPIGGVATALKKSDSFCIMFFGCDMPFLSAELLNDFFKAAMQVESAIFTKHSKGLGFPFLIYRKNLLKVQEQIDKGEFSLQRLARSLSARSWVPSRRFESKLFNINSPEDLIEAKRRIDEG